MQFRIAGLVTQILFTNKTSNFKLNLRLPGYLIAQTFPNNVPLNCDHGILFFIEDIIMWLAVKRKLGVT